MRVRLDPPPRSHPRRVAILGAALVAVLLSCGKDATAPLATAARYASGLSWNAVFPQAFQTVGGSSSGIVSFDRVHVVLHRTSGSVALDTVIDFPAGADSLTVGLTVRLLENAPATGEPMTLNLGYINAAGDTVFKGGPVSVTAAPPPPGGGPNPPVQVPVSYTGTGANAASVVISPRLTSVFSGGSFAFTAIAKDANGAALAGTPVVWNSLDPSVATITSAAAGAGIGQNQRGTARIVAQLLTGPADTAFVEVLLPASRITAQSGNGQSGVIGTQLPQPLVVRVTASDGDGVGGIHVVFAPSSGGSVANPSVLTDASGLAATTWKLGPITGVQSVTVTSGTLTNSPLLFTATAVSGTPTNLAVTAQPSNGTAGLALSSVVITALDASGNFATSFTGPVTVALGANAGGATLGGTTTVNAVAGVATFSTLTLNRPGTGYTLVASSTGLTSATTSAFNIVVGAPSKLVFTVQPSTTIANVVITPSIVVNAQDSQGNATPTFTGAVTLGIATNPSGASLGGTLTVNAVAGVATFPGISVSSMGSGYALSASAAGLTTGVSSQFDVTVGPPANFTVVSGDGQSGPPGAALPLPIVVMVSDAYGNGVPGAQVTFTPNFGSSGTTSPPSGETDASGMMSTVWTLGGGIGEALIVTTGALPMDSLTVSANCTPGCGEFALAGVRGTAATAADDTAWPVLAFRKSSTRLRIR